MSEPVGDVAFVGVTPKAAISKEDDRRLKLQQWKESKAASEKKGAPSDSRKAAPDRKAQFFERRERRLQEEREKRASRSGKENNMPTAVSSSRLTSAVGAW